MRVVELSGGVGGARLARGLAALDGVDLTVIVNVGDDDRVHGLHVSPDLDTVVYTLAGIEGPEGWGRAGDTFRANDELARFGADNRFRLGDLDLALNLYRTDRLAQGDTLSDIVKGVCAGFGVGTVVLPITNDRLQTRVQIGDGSWIPFQEYFVLRGNRDAVNDIRFVGARESAPAPGALEAIAASDVVVIGPSNPPLSIWPILAVPGVRRVLESHRRVIAVTPLISGKALKGPADRVMQSLGLPPGNAGVLESYAGLIDTLVVHSGDERPAEAGEVDLVEDDIMIQSPAAATRLATSLLAL